MPMSERLKHGLSKRERQIMNVIYRRGEAGVAGVMADIPDPPGYSAVRAMLNILGKKGLLKRRKDGRKYIYRPTIPRHRAMRAAVDQLMKTYFEGSVEDAIAAIVQVGKVKLSDEEAERLLALIREAKKRE
jgi:predicted transcriptional regulator